MSWVHIPSVYLCERFLEGVLMVTKESQERDYAFTQERRHEMFDSFNSCSLIRNLKIIYWSFFLTLNRESIYGELWRDWIKKPLDVILGIGTLSKFPTILVYLLNLFFPFLNPEEMSLCRIQVMGMIIVVIGIIVMGTPTIIWCARLWFWKIVHLDFLLSNLQVENPSSL